MNLGRFCVVAIATLLGSNVASAERSDTFGGGSFVSTAQNITRDDTFGDRDTRRETANGIPISNEPLILKTSNVLIGAMACTNPNAALMLIAMNRLSQQVPTVLPTVGIATTVKKVTCSDVLTSMKMNGDDAQIWDAAPPISQNKDDYGKMSWVLSKNGDSNATLHLNYGVFDFESYLIDEPYPDIVLDLEWVPVNSAGYWNTVRSSGEK